MTIAERISRWIFVFGHGLNVEQYMRLVEIHEAGEERRFIEELFTELNYHSECKALKNRDYKLALELYNRD